MTRARKLMCALAALGFLSTITACNNNNSNDAPKVIAGAANSVDDADKTNLLDDEADQALSAVIGASEIPYPVYPNGSKYRVGGENGLKIVVFQTEDPFHKVDKYYSGMSDNSGMSRIMAMTDYVRYAGGDSDLDPWATHLPGIVIHEFSNDTERAAVGANAMAKTNIIMSF